MASPTRILVTGASGFLGAQEWALRCDRDEMLDLIQAEWRTHANGAAGA